MPSDTDQPASQPDCSTVSGSRRPRHRSPEKPRKPDPYRDGLIECSNTSIDEYAKTVVLLSGGALGISMTFVKDILQPENAVMRFWLYFAWASWALSVTCIGLAHYLSHRAHERAIRLYDEKKDPCGTWWNTMTIYLSPCAGILFLAGLIFMGLFVDAQPYGKQPETGTATPTTTNSPAADGTAGSNAGPVQRP